GQGPRRAVPARRGEAMRVCGATDAPQIAGQGVTLSATCWVWSSDIVAPGGAACGSSSAGWSSFGTRQTWRASEVTKTAYRPAVIAVGVGATEGSCRLTLDEPFATAVSAAVVR